MRDQKGARRRLGGDASNGNAGLNLGSRQALPDKTFRLLNQVRYRQTLAIEHAVTADMADGQPLPPLIEDGRVWHVVHRADGRTIWRRLFLKSSPVNNWRAVSGDQMRAP